MSQANTQMFEFAVSPFNEVYLPAINRQQFETRESTRIFGERYPDLLEPGFLNLVIGTDSGLLADYVLQQGVLTDSRFIFVELESVLEILTIDIPQEQASALTIITVDELALRLSQESNEVYMLKSKLRLFESLGAQKAYYQDYLSLKTRTNRIVEKAFFDVSVNLTQKNFVQKQLINLCDNRHPVSKLTGRFQGKDCIIVGGGPSLDEHIQWLRQHQSNLYTIAVSRAAHQLHKAGIDVDFVISVDPQEISFSVSKEMLQLPQSSIFINSDHAVPSLVGQWPATQLYLGNGIPWEQGDNIDTAGPTVSNAALSMAGNLGFGRILLLGVDMCWSPKGVSHASGSPEAQMGPDISKIGVWVETNSGDTAETTVQLANAMKSLETQIEMLQDCRVYNLSAYAAKIAGVTYLAPESLSLDSSLDKTQILFRIRRDFSHRANKDELIRLKKQIKGVRKKYQHIASQAEKALKLVSQLPTSFNELNRLEDNLNAQYPLYMKFMKFYGYKEFSRFLSTQDAEHWNSDDITNIHHDYYQAMEEVAQSLNHCLGDTITHINVRIEELKPNPNADILFPDWMKYNQPARLDMLLSRHPDWLDTLTPAQQHSLAQLREKQQQSLQDTLRHFATNEKLTSWGLQVVPQKIHSLKETQNTPGLIQLIYALDTFQTSDEAKQLSARAKSYLHEIKGEYQQAFEVLADLPEAWRGEVENKQMVLMAIKIGQWEAAVNGLKQLTPHSDEYLLQLAQVLKIRKDYAGALETWLEYLNKHPSDSANWCKLGEMLLQLEQYQDALSIYQQALLADPDNRLAQQYVAELSRGLAK